MAKKTRAQRSGDGAGTAADLLREALDRLTRAREAAGDEHRPALRAAIDRVAEVSAALHRPAGEEAPGSAHVGDWVVARGLPGQPSRQGQVTEVLGRPGHEHYRVRWDEQHESILFPADGVRVLPEPPGSEADAGVTRR